MIQAWTDVNYLEGAVLLNHYQVFDLLLRRFAGDTLAFRYFGMHHPSLWRRYGLLGLA